METATLYFSVCIIAELKFVYNNDLHEKLIALFKGISLSWRRWERGGAPGMMYVQPV